MKDHSIFVTANDNTEETHNLTRKEALGLAISKLYTNNILIPNVKLLVRTPQRIVFTASNPIAVNVR